MHIAVNDESCTTHVLLVMQSSSSSSYEDNFEEVQVRARLHAFPRPGSTKVDTKLPREFRSKIRLDAPKPQESKPWSKLPGEALLGLGSGVLSLRLMMIFCSR